MELSVRANIERRKPQERRNTVPKLIERKGPRAVQVEQVSEYVIEAPLRELLIVSGRLTPRHRQVIEQAVVGVMSLSSTVQVPLSMSDADTFASAFRDLGYTVVREQGKPQDTAAPLAVVKVPSDSRYGVKHTVNVYAATCTCEDFTIRGSNPCKHIRRLGSHLGW